MPTVVSISRDRELLFLRAKVLESAGFTVINAMSPDEAVRALDRSAADALLIGHSIPNEQAMQLAQSAKRAHPQIKVCRIQRTWREQNDDGVIDAFIDSQGSPEELVRCLQDAIAPAE